MKIGFWELIVIVIVAFVFIGPRIVGRMYDAACLFQERDHILLLAMIDHISSFLCLLQDLFVGRIVTASTDMEHRVGVLRMDTFGSSEIQVDSLFLQNSGCKLEVYCLAFRGKYGKNKTFPNKNQKNACAGTRNMVS